MISAIRPSHIFQYSDLRRLITVMTLLGWPTKVAACLVLTLIHSCLTNRAEAGPLQKIEFGNDISLFSEATEEIVIFGEDKRRPIPQHYKSLLDRIGLLENRRTRTICTAFCVEPDLIATAAHCLFIRRTGRSQMRLMDFYFRTSASGRNQGSGIVGDDEQEANWNIVAGSSRFPSKISGLYPTHHDWALARLKQPACRKGGFKLAAKTLAELVDASRRGQVLHVAYHNEAGQVKLQLSKDCQISSQFGNFPNHELEDLYPDLKKIVPHRCDAAEGSSGSPLLLDTTDGVVAVAIQSGWHWRSNAGDDKEQTSNNDRDYTHARAINTSVFIDKAKLIKNPVERMSGAALLELQIRLRGTGDYKGKTDGLYGPKTRQAILDFERRHKLPATGRPDPILLTMFSQDVTKAPPEQATWRLEWYLTNGKSKDMKALAVDPVTGSAGYSFGYSSASEAIERAMRECKDHGETCQLYAVGDTIIYGLPKHRQQAAIDAYQNTIERTSR